MVFSLRSPFGAENRDSCISSRRIMEPADQTTAYRRVFCNSRIFSGQAGLRRIFLVLEESFLCSNPGSIVLSRLICSSNWSTKGPRDRLGASARVERWKAGQQRPTPKTDPPGTRPWETSSGKVRLVAAMRHTSIGSGLVDPIRWSFVLWGLPVA